MQDFEQVTKGLARAIEERIQEEQLRMLWGIHNEFKKKKDDKDIWRVIMYALGMLSGILIAIVVRRL